MSSESLRVGWWGKRFHHFRHAKGYKASYRSIKCAFQATELEPQAQSDQIKVNCQSKAETIKAPLQTLLDHMTPNGRKAFAQLLALQLIADLEKGEASQFWKLRANQRALDSSPRTSVMEGHDHELSSCYEVCDRSLKDNALRPLFQSTKNDLDKKYWLEAWLAVIIASEAETLIRKTLFDRVYRNRTTWCNRSLQLTYFITTFSGLLVGISLITGGSALLILCGVLLSYVSLALMSYRAVFVYHNTFIDRLISWYIFSAPSDSTDLVKGVFNDALWAETNTADIIYDLDLMTTGHGCLFSAHFLPGALFTCFYLVDWMRDVWCAYQDYQRARNAYQEALSEFEQLKKQRVSRTEDEPPSLRRARMALKKARQAMEDARRQIGIINISDGGMTGCRGLISYQWLAQLAHATSLATLTFLLPVDILLIAALFFFTFLYETYQAFQTPNNRREQCLALMGLTVSTLFIGLPIVGMAMASTAIIFHLFPALLVALVIGSIAYAGYRLYGKEKEFVETHKKQLGMAIVGALLLYGGGVAAMTVLATTLPLWGVALIAGGIAVGLAIGTYQLLTRGFGVLEVYAKRFAIESVGVGVLLGGLIVALTIGASITLIVGFIGALAALGLFIFRQMNKLDRLSETKPFPDAISKTLDKELNKAFAEAEAEEFTENVPMKSESLSMQKTYSATLTCGRDLDENFLEEELKSNNEIFSPNVSKNDSGPSVGGVTTNKKVVLFAFPAFSKDWYDPMACGKETNKVGPESEFRPNEMRCG